MTNIPYNIDHETFDRDRTERILAASCRRLIVILALKDTFHDENHVLDEQRILIVNNNLAWYIEESVDDELYLIEKDRVALGIELVTE